jgi:hypothetical protein
METDNQGNVIWEGQGINHKGDTWGSFFIPYDLTQLENHLAVKSNYKSTHREIH